MHAALAASTFSFMLNGDMEATWLNLHVLCL